ncbi:MAG: XRE family transcriptional regulator [Chitinophagaceae bacterium]|nr:MAG: XRE family transcriptional regulator [Chitinophagaceae bacterium]
MKIHKKIRAIRLSKGYKQNYMAYKLDIDTANYGRLERGETKITIERLEALAKIFDLDITELVNVNRETTQNATLQDDEITEINHKLSKILYEIQYIRQQLIKTKHTK